MSTYFIEYEILRKIVIAFSVLLAVIIIQFFRKPTRQIVKNLNAIIAPADGKVVVIEETIENLCK